MHFMKPKPNQLTFSFLILISLFLTSCKVVSTLYAKIRLTPVKSRSSEVISPYLPFLWLNHPPFCFEKPVHFNLDGDSVSKIIIG